MCTITLDINVPEQVLLMFILELISCRPSLNQIKTREFRSIPSSLTSSQIKHHDGSAERSLPVIHASLWDCLRSDARLNLAWVCFEAQSVPVLHPRECWVWTGGSSVSQRNSVPFLTGSDSSWEIPAAVRERCWPSHPSIDWLIDWLCRYFVFHEKKCRCCTKFAQLRWFKSASGLQWGVFTQSDISVFIAVSTLNWFWIRADMILSGFCPYTEFWEGTEQL